MRDSYNNTIANAETISIDTGSGVISRDLMVPLSNVEISVFVVAADGTSNVPATIYQARNPSSNVQGPTPQSGATITGPGVFVTGDSGAVEFYAEPGEYRIHVNDLTVPNRIADADYFWNSQNMQDKAIPSAKIKDDAALDLNALSQAILRQAVPIGAVLDWFRPASSVALPSGFAVCDGSTITAANHDFGTGGSITLPDLRNKFIVGANDGAADASGGSPSTAPGIRGQGGANEVTLSAVQSGVGAHGHGDNISVSHNLSIGSGNANINASINGGGNIGLSYVATGVSSRTGNFNDLVVDGGHGHPLFGGVSKSGGVSNNPGQAASQPHTNMPAYYGLLKIMKVKRS